MTYNFCPDFLQGHSNKDIHVYRLLQAPGHCCKYFVATAYSSGQSYSQRSETKAAERLSNLPKLTLLGKGGVGLEF